jgi:hypothetical protein
MNIDSVKQTTFELLGAFFKLIISDSGAIVITHPKLHHCFRMEGTTRKSIKISSIAATNFRDGSRNQHTEIKLRMLRNKNIRSQSNTTFLLR